MRVAVLSLGALVACGGGGGGDDSGGPDGGGDDASTPDAAPVTCQGKTAQELQQTWTMTVDGRERRVRVHVPASYDPSRATPVVLGFHGYTLSGDMQAAASHMEAKADAAGFITVHPDGTGGLKGWNAGDCCGTAASSGVDDVGFVTAILDRLEADMCIDTARVYATGFSNGGFLSHRLGCELSGRIAAIAPVSGVMGMDSCDPGRPIPVFEVHGTADAVVPYNGGGIGGFRSVTDTIADWAARNQCPPGAPAVTYDQGDARCETVVGCPQDAAVTLCTIEGGGHQWPGGEEFPGGGHLSMDLIATDAIWDFFVAHPHP